MGWQVHRQLSTLPPPGLALLFLNFYPKGLKTSAYTKTYTQGWGYNLTAKRLPSTAKCWVAIPSTPQIEGEGEGAWSWLLG